MDDDDAVAMESCAQPTADERRALGLAGGEPRVGDAIKVLFAQAAGSDDEGGDGEDTWYEGTVSAVSRHATAASGPSRSKSAKAATARFRCEVTFPDSVLDDVLVPPVSKEDDAVVIPTSVAASKAAANPAATGSDRKRPKQPAKTSPGASKGSRPVAKGGGGSGGGGSGSSPPGSGGKRARVVPVDRKGKAIDPPKTACVVLRPTKACALSPM
jgi:hypothetical protein